jgi:hypothetical protein
MKMRFDSIILNTLPTAPRKGTIVNATKLARNPSLAIGYGERISA